MSYSKTTLVRRIRDRIGEQAWYDVCTEAMDTSETGLDVADTTKWAVGDVLEFQDDGERCQVTALPSGTTLTVVRGYMSDTPGTGTNHSISTQVVKRPVVSYGRIVEAVTTVLDSLWPMVYAKVTTDIAPTSTSLGWYSVAATYEFLVDAEQKGTSTSPTLYNYGGPRSDHPIQLVQNLADNVPITGTTGKAVYIPVHWNFTNTIRVTGGRRVKNTETVAGTYDDFSAGVEVNCIIFLAVEDLLAGADLGRLLNRDNSMYDATVVPGRRSQIADNYWHKMGMMYKRQWRDDLQASIPEMQGYADSRLTMNRFRGHWNPLA